MKKQYTKPCIAYEEYSLSSNIASNSCGSHLSFHGSACLHQATMADYTHGCMFFENGTSLFLDVVTCDGQPDGKSWSELCYHVITDDMRAFSS